MPDRRTRLTVSLVVAAVLAAAAIVGVRALWRTTTQRLASNTCTVGAYQLDTDQAAVASTMVGAVTTFRTHLPQRASVLALAAALQESKLRNIAPGAGDRDSVGVLQQRPSQGWGSVQGRSDTIADRTKRLEDVGEATDEFLSRLVKIDNWQTRPLAEAVQAVQISADGSLYAQHEPEATALAAALSGRTAAGITCDFDAPTLVAEPTVVQSQVAGQLGLDTFTRVSNGVRVPGAHWQTASWFVANADRLGIEEVAYAGRSWSRTSARWSADPQAPSSAVVATLYVRKG